MNRISYSQISLYSGCPLAWKLAYVDKIRLDKPSQFTMFGRVMHLLLQKRITNHYTNRKLTIDAKKLLLLLITKLYLELKTQRNNNEDFIDGDLLYLLYDSGIQIYELFLKKIKLIFPYRGYLLVGILLPLEYKFSELLQFIGYIDVIIKNKKLNTYKIFDIKTSYKGWDKLKSSEVKKLQLSLYKHFYSKIFNVLLNNIEVLYLIIKRKVFQPQNVLFKISRIQRFKPACGKIVINKHLRTFFLPFINACYPSHSPATKLTYDEFKPNPSQLNCKYCQYATSLMCFRGKKWKK